MRKIQLAFASLYKECVLALPDEFSRFRIAYYNRRGCEIDRLTSLSPNVHLRGNAHNGPVSSVTQFGLTGSTEC